MNKYIIFFFVFLILGLIFKTEKVSYLIAGFQSLSPKEKRKWNQNKLCKFVGNLMFVMSFFYLISSVLDYTLPSISNYLFRLVTMISTILALIALIYVNLSKKFKM